MQNDENDNHSREMHIIVFFCTVLMLICVGAILLIVPEKTISGEFIKENYVWYSSGVFFPERVEKLQFIICSVLFPLLYVITYKIYEKYGNKANLFVYANYCSWSVFTFLACLTFISLNKNHDALQLFMLFNKDISILILLLIIIFSPIPLVLSEKVKERFPSIKIFPATVVVILAVWVIYLFFTKTYDYMGEGLLHHYDAYFYPVYKVYSGQVLGLDFHDNYGFYPYLIVPILKAFGPITIASFSLFMGILSAITFVSFSCFIYKICRNKFIAMAGSIACLYVSLLYRENEIIGAPVLQQFPHRILFPAVFLLIAYLQVEASASDKRRYWLKGLAYVLSIVSIIWNTETGLILLIVNFLFQSYLQLLEKKADGGFRFKKVFPDVLKNGCFALLSLLCSLGMIYLLTYLQSGNLISVFELFSRIFSYYFIGFGMIKMPVIGIWWLVVGIYTISLSKSLILFLEPFKKDETDHKNSLYLFLLAIMGIGLFLYYQGRSHWHSIIYVSWVAVLLITKWVDILVQSSEKNLSRNRANPKLNYLMIVLGFGILCYLSFFAGREILSPAHHIRTHKEMQKTSYRSLESVTNYPDPNGSLVNQMLFLYDSIRTDEEEEEDIVIIATGANEVLSRFEKKNVAPIPEITDLILVSDLDKILDYLDANTHKVIISWDAYNELVTFRAEKTNSILTEKYTLIKDFGDHRAFAPSNR